MKWNKQLSLTCLFLIFFLTDHAQVRLIPFIQGLSSPTSFTVSSTQRFYILEKTGKVVTADSNGLLNSIVFLDITDRVKSEATEQGLLGIALHPNFNMNGYFYLNYTGNGDSTHISRFTRDPADTNRALPESEQKILTIYQPFQNHNGGDLHFGPLTNLFIALGDGGGAGDPGNRAQNKGILLGKILRINVNAGNNYSIPPDNPFVTDPTARPEIWSLGLRNPWKFSFDRTTGDLWIGDVGQGQREEVDLEPYGTPGGRNYGWRCYEGSLPYQTDGCQSQNTYTFPVYEYAHDTSPCWAITGGYRYRGTLNPKMYGKYFFDDYCKDIIGSLSDSSGTWSARTEGVFAGNNFSSFGEDNNGEIYIAGLSSGRIFRIADSAASGIAEQQADLFRVYPDPFEDHLIVEQKNPSGKMGLIIFDLRGKSIYTCALSGTRTSLDLQFLPAGIYFIQGKNDQFIFTRKIIKKSK